MPEDSGQHWRNQIEVFVSSSLPKLRDLLNDFYKDRFVIATQVFPDFRQDAIIWSAIVYFKVPPESKQ